MLKVLFSLHLWGQINTQSCSLICRNQKYETMDLACLVPCNQTVLQRAAKTRFYCFIISGHRRHLWLLLVILHMNVRNGTSALNNPAFGETFAARAEWGRGDVWRIGVTNICTTLLTQELHPAWSLPYCTLWACVWLHIL